MNDRRASAGRSQSFARECPRETSKSLHGVAARVTPLQRAAAIACLGMAVVLVLYQFVLTPDVAAPRPLFLVFTLVWLFGAAMLALLPRFGAAGTLAYGLISAWGAWRTHAVASIENVILVGGSLLAAALAGWFLVERLRAKRLT